MESLTSDIEAELAAAGSLSDEKNGDVEGSVTDSDSPLKISKDQERKNDLSEGESLTGEVNHSNKEGQSKEREVDCPRSHATKEPRDK